MNADDTAGWDIDRSRWDERVPPHLGSAYYDVAGFRSGQDTIQPFEHDEVGDVAGKDLVHPQCHIGLERFPGRDTALGSPGSTLPGP